MPYEIVRSGSGYKVAKKTGGKTFSKKPLSKTKAVAQMRAIYANEDHKPIFDLTKLIESVIEEDGNVDVGGGPDEDELFGREPRNVTNEPVSVTAPKQDLIRPAGGTVSI
jgi:hypothetical protein